MEWAAGGLGFCLFALYIFMIFTVAIMTFKKGHIILGVLGIFLPFLWLVGAILPAKEGSRWEIEEDIRRQQQMDEYTR